MKYIELSGNKGQGHFAIVDDEDYEFLNRLKWYPVREYAVHLVTDGGKKECFSMHSVVLGRKTGFVIDHINRNRLDNRKVNLRHVSRAQNSRNAKLSKNNTSGFKGIHKTKNRKRWMAMIKHEQEKIYLGTFDTAIEAAIAYDNAVRELKDELAYTNFAALQ